MEEVIFPHSTSPYHTTEMRYFLPRSIPHLTLTISILRLSAASASQVITPPPQAATMATPCTSKHSLSVLSLSGNSPRSDDQSRRLCALFPFRRGRPTNGSLPQPRTEPDAASSRTTSARSTSPTTQAPVFAAAWTLSGSLPGVS
jgi:hypothetical protein